MFQEDNRRKKKQIRDNKKKQKKKSKEKVTLNFWSAIEFLWKRERKRREKIEKNWDKERIKKYNENFEQMFVFRHHFW